MKWEPTICECGDHAFAPATLGYTTMVSPEDIGLLSRPCQAQISQVKLCSVLIKQAFWDGAYNRTLILSRRILRVPPGFYVDHINCDPTDNRRQNLRKASPQQNSWNRRSKPGKAVPSKGVSFTGSGKYQASIMKAGRRQYLGSFETEAEAALAYQRAAEVLHGEFARFN